MENEQVFDFIEKYAKLVLEKGVIENELYGKYDVKRGRLCLRRA